LTSESGRQLNGQNGIATRKIPETGRFEVRIGVEKKVTVKPENLRLHQVQSGKKVEDLGFGEADRQAEMEAAAMFRPGDQVEIGGLGSVQGRELNGKMAEVVEDFETPPDRVKIRCELGGPGNRVRHATLKPANLRKIVMAGLTDEQKAKLQALKDEKEAKERASENDRFARVDMKVESDGPVEAGAPFSPGDVIEVAGLTSAAGKELNGQKGVVLKCFTAEGRAEVRMPYGIKKLKFENITKMDLEGGDRYMVEIFGLQSESGKANNGCRGFVTAKNEETGRFEVKINKDKKLSLKPDNLKLLITEG